MWPELPSFFSEKTLISLTYLQLTESTQELNTHIHIFLSKNIDRVKVRFQC